MNMHDKRMAILSAVENGAVAKCSSDGTWRWTPRMEAMPSLASPIIAPMIASDWITYKHYGWPLELTATSRTLLKVYRERTNL